MFEVLMQPQHKFFAVVSNIRQNMSYSTILYGITQDFDVFEILNTSKENFQIIKENFKLKNEDYKYIVVVGHKWSQSVVNTYDYFSYEFYSTNLKLVFPKENEFKLVDNPIIESYRNKWSEIFINVKFTNESTKEFNIQLDIEYPRNRMVKKIALILKKLNSIKDSNFDESEIKSVLKL